MALRQRDVAGIVGDLTLTAEAVRIVLDVALRGPGEHEIKQTHFRGLLHQCSERYLRSVIAIAENAGWITERRGGRGHANVYTFNPAPTSGSNERIDPDAHAGSSGPTSPAFDQDLEAGSSGDLTRCQSAGQKRTPVSAQNREHASPGFGSNFNTNPDDASKRPHARVSQASVNRLTEDVEEEKDARARALSIEVEEIIFDNESLFTGCRGTLRDYLKNWVEPRRQTAYVQTLVMWLKGFPPVFLFPDGSSVEPGPDRAKWVAAALNEMGGGRELMARPVGDPANLKTKLNILLKKDWYDRNPSDSRGTNGRGAAGQAGRETGSQRAATDGDFDHLG